MPTHEQSLLLNAHSWTVTVTQCPLMNSHCYSMPSHEQSILSRLSSTCPNIHWLCVTSLDKDGSAIQHESHGVKAKPLKNNAPSFVMTISTDHVTTLACTYACNCFRGKSGKTNWEVQLWLKRKIHVGKCGFLNLVAANHTSLASGCFYRVLSWLKSYTNTPDEFNWKPQHIHIAARSKINLKAYYLLLD